MILLHVPRLDTPYQIDQIEFRTHRMMDPWGPTVCNHLSRCMFDARADAKQYCQRCYQELLRLMDRTAASSKARYIVWTLSGMPDETSYDDRVSHAMLARSLWDAGIQGAAQTLWDASSQIGKTEYSILRHQISETERLKWAKGLIAVSYLATVQGGSSQWTHLRVNPASQGAAPKLESHSIVRESHDYAAKEEEKERRYYEMLREKFANRPWAHVKRGRYEYICTGCNGKILAQTQSWRVSGQYKFCMSCESRIRRDEEYIPEGCSSIIIIAAGVSLATLFTGYKLLL